LEVARVLGMPVEALRAKSTIKGEEACHTQDTVLRRDGDTKRQRFY
jgi:hypothetical protein